MSEPHMGSAIRAYRGIFGKKVQWGRLDRSVASGRRDVGLAPLLNRTEDMVSVCGLFSDPVSNSLVALQSQTRFPEGSHLQLEVCGHLVLARGTEVEEVSPNLHLHFLATDVAVGLHDGLPVGWKCWSICIIGSCEPNASIISSRS